MILNLEVAWGARLSAMASTPRDVFGAGFPSQKKVKSTLTSRAKRYLRRLVPCLVKAAAVISENSSGRRVLSDRKKA